MLHAQIDNIPAGIPSILASASLLRLSLADKERGEIRMNRADKAMHRGIQTLAASNQRGRSCLCRPRADQSVGNRHVRTSAKRGAAADGCRRQANARHKTGARRNIMGNEDATRFISCLATTGANLAPNASSPLYVADERHKIGTESRTPSTRRCKKFSRSAEISGGDWPGARNANSHLTGKKFCSHVKKEEPVK